MNTQTKTRYRKNLKSSEICHFWANKIQPEGKCGNVFFENGTIYSYGYHFKIASFEKNKEGKECILYNSRSYSKSTSKHQSAVKRAIPRNIQVFTVPYMIDHIGNMEAYTSNILGNIKSAVTARTNKEYLLGNAEELAIELKEYAAFFNLSLTEEQKELINKAENKSMLTDTERATMKAAAIAKNKKEIEDNKDKISEWINGKGHSLSIDKIYLRRKDDKVQTSHNVEVPVLEARKLYHALKSGVNVVSKQIGNFYVNSFNGKYLVIGCHKLDMSEVERFAASQNWIKA